MVKLTYRLHIITVKLSYITLTSSEVDRSIHPWSGLTALRNIWTKITRDRTHTAVDNSDEILFVHYSYYLMIIMSESFNNYWKTFPGRLNYCAPIIEIVVTRQVACNPLETTLSLVDFIEESDDKSKKKNETVISRQNKKKTNSRKTIKGNKATNYKNGKE